MMKRISHILLVCLISLSPALCRADRITTSHNFHTMSSDATKLEFKNGNKTGITPLLTYTCSGTNATFGVTGVFVGLQLPSSGGQVVTTRIDELAEFQIFHSPGSKCTSIKVYVSKDGSSWSAALSGDSIAYSSGYINVTLPRNNYYVKIAATANITEFYISGITWYQDHCNCFVYEP